MISFETSPASRFAWPGTELTYRLRAEGAEHLALRDVPGCVEASLTDECAFEGGCEATLRVVPKGGALD